jgi:hypothetical protein
VDSHDEIFTDEIFILKPPGATDKQTSSKAPAAPRPGHGPCEPVALESTNFFILKPPGATDKQTSSKAPAAPRRGMAPSTIEIRGAGGEHATGTCLCVIALLGLPCFFLRQASGRRRQKTGKQAAQKKEKQKKGVSYFIFHSIHSS